MTNFQISQIDNITSLDDVHLIEQTPLSARMLPASTYHYIRLVAMRYPNRVAIRYIENVDVWKTALDNGRCNASVSYRYSDLLAKIHQAANFFRSLGVGDKDVVSIILPNVPDNHVALWGAQTCGIANPINHLLDASEIGAIVRAANSKVIVLFGSHTEVDIWQKMPEILRHAPQVNRVVVVGEFEQSLDERVISFSAGLSEQSDVGLDFDRQWNTSSTAALFHTGGTTGTPKLAQHTHKNEVYSAWIISSLLGDASDVCYLTGLPLFHCNAAIGSGLSVLSRGGTVFLAGINGFRGTGTVEHLFELISHFRITHFNTVPTIIGLLLQQENSIHDLISMKFAVCGAAPMPVDLFNRFQSKTGIRLLEGYGLTEATVCSSISPPSDVNHRIGSIGIRLPYTQMKVSLVEAGKCIIPECGVDEIGTLLIRGPAVTPGYVDESHNKSLFVADDKGRAWLNTGDLARQDADGYFWLTGRAKELIIRGGHNIDPKSIEEVLSSHPAVGLAAAIGKPDRHAGEIPVAYVNAIATVTESELLAWCQSYIGERAAIPKAINIVENLPVTGVGKIHKPTLVNIEIQKVVEKEMNSLQPLYTNYDVKVVLNPKYGHVAEVFATCANSSFRSELNETINTALAGYSFKYQLNIELENQKIIK